MKFELPKIDGREICLMCENFIDGQYCINCDFQAYYSIKNGTVYCSHILYGENKFSLTIDFNKNLIYYGYYANNFIDKELYDKILKPSKINHPITKKWIKSKLNSLNSLKLLL